MHDVSGLARHDRLVPYTRCELYEPDELSPPHESLYSWFSFLRPKQRNSMAMTSTRTSLKRKMSPPERPSPRPSPVPPAFAVGRGNQNERELPPTYILATSPVALYSDYRHSRQLPLSLILLITSYVRLILLKCGVLKCGI
jgi:hypothetical protein